MNKEIILREKNKVDVLHGLQDNKLDVLIEHLSRCGYQEEALFLTNNPDFLEQTDNS
jgi:hypothetical protein